jgi:hypothetical protein
MWLVFRINPCLTIWHCHQRERKALRNHSKSPHAIMYIPKIMKASFCRSHNKFSSTKDKLTSNCNYVGICGSIIGLTWTGTMCGSFFSPVIATSLLTTPLIVSRRGLQKLDFYFLQKNRVCPGYSGALSTTRCACALNPAQHAKFAPIYSDLHQSDYKW